MKKNLFFLVLGLLLSIVVIAQNISNTLEFDGIDDYVSITNGTALISGLSEFSMCGWVYPTNPNTSWPDFEGYFGIKNEGICDFYLVQLYGLGLEARLTTNTGTYTLNPADLSEVTMNEWQHFAIVYTGSELQVFYNGVLDGSIAASGTIDFNNMQFTFGMLEFPGQNFYLDGKIDEITIWDKALTESEILEYQCISGDPSSVPNLTAYYNFNEEEGLVLPDYFENYDGTLTNMNGDEWITSEVCESGYTITFIVNDEDSGLPVEDAVVNLQGIVKNTDSNGEVEFTNYDPGLYPWSVTKTDYYESVGEVAVIDEDVIVEVELAPILYYDITFVVTQDPGGLPVDSAIVNVDGVIQYTDETGTITFSGYLPGTYSYNISKDGYNLTFGDAVVIDENLTIEVNLVLIGINQYTDKEINIYPNPSDGLIRIDLLKARMSTADVIVRNLTGQMIMRKQIDKKSALINLSGFEKGMYFLEIHFENRIINKPVIIK